MDLFHESYAVVKNLAQQKGLSNVPVIYLLPLLSGISAEMCGAANPNTTGHPIVSYKDFDTIMGEEETKLAEGGFGEIFLTKSNNIVKKGKSDYESSDIREIAILNYLNHPNIICLFGATFNKNILRIGLPKATVNMADYDLSTMPVRKAIFYQLFRGLAYIHSKHIWHLDMKNKNVLIFPKESGQTYDVAKIADFGISTVYSKPETKPDPNNIVTLWWRAPELLIGFENYTELVDEWALGVMLLNAVWDSKQDPIFWGVEETDQLWSIFTLLGYPASKDWNDPDLDTEIEDLTSDAQQLLVPDKAQKRVLSPDVIPNNSGIDIPFDPEEYAVINDTVTWPTLRKSSIKILSYPYFSSISKIIDTEVPADPIKQETCGEIMRQDIHPIKQLLPDVRRRRERAIIWLFKLPLTTQTKYYALTLLDKYLATDAPYSAREVGILLIIAEQFIDPQNFDIIDSRINYYNKGLNVNIDRSLISSTLEKLQFDLVFPTCYDFLFEYVDTTNKLYLDINDDLLKILKNVYLEYAEFYQPDHLAQLAILASGADKSIYKGNCIDKSLYTWDI